MTDLKPGWKRVKFGEVVRLNKETCKDPVAAGINRVIGLEHLEPGDLRVRSWADVADGTTFSNRVRPGQVLFGKRRAYQRKVAVADFDAICSGDIYVLQSANPQKLLQDLLPFICQSEGFFEHAVGTSAGSLSPRTNWESLAGFEFALPPLEEQWRITTLFRSIVSAINHRAELVCAKNKLIISLIKQNEKEVPRIALGDVYDIIGGYAFKSTDYLGQGVPLMRIGNIENRKVIMNEATKFLPPHFLSDFMGYAVEKGDMLVGLSGATTGKSGIYLHDVPSLLNQRVARLRIRPGYAQEEAFFRYSLNLVEPTILKIAGGSAQPNISTGSLSAIEVSCPSESRRMVISQTILRFERSSLYCSEMTSCLKRMLTNLLAA